MRPQRFALLLSQAPKRGGITITPEESAKIKAFMNQRHYSVPMWALIVGRRLLRRAGLVIAMEEFNHEIRLLCQKRIMRVRFAMRGRLSLVPPAPAQLPPPRPTAPEATVAR